MKNNIASERKRMSLTQCELAEQLRVSEQSVGRWERGEFDPPGDRLLVMREVFGCTVDYLLGLTDERT